MDEAHDLVLRSHTRFGGTMRHVLFVGKICHARISVICAIEDFIVLRETVLGYLTFGAVCNIGWGHLKATTAPDSKDPVRLACRCLCDVVDPMMKSRVIASHHLIIGAD